MNGEIVVTGEKDQTGRIHTARVTWLPVGHITHGYRRVFVIHENGTLRHVVHLPPMPYEVVYQIWELSGKDKEIDPSLWWGLSTITSLVSAGTLLSSANPDHADDGYIQQRPQVLAREEDLLPVPKARVVFAAGALVLSRQTDASPWRMA